MIVRAERDDDREAVAQVVRQAFGGDAEASLVERLRRDGDCILALVAERDGRIVGHIAFSPMTAPFAALGLAPLSVLPHCQRSGIGSALVRKGLGLARSRGWDAVFVLGDPAFYRRFGFSAEAAGGFSTPYAGPCLMLLAFDPPLPACDGPIAYAPAFDGLA